MERSSSPSPCGVQTLTGGVNECLSRRRNGKERGKYERIRRKVLMFRELKEDGDNWRKNLENDEKIRS
jgi:hypothetical protein